MMNDSTGTFAKRLQPLTHVLVVEDINSRQTIVLDEANYSLGRDARNSIVLSSKKVSRFHATLLRRTDNRKKTFAYWILDGDLQGNRSTNGIFINDKRCLVQELKNEDAIKLGVEVQARYYVISNFSDLKLIQSGDFKNQHSDKINQPVRNPYNLDEEDVDDSEADTKILNQKKSKKSVNQERLIISEANVEKSTEEKFKLDSPDLTKLASFPELSPNPIIEIDWNGNITYLNPAANYKFKHLLNSSSNNPLLAGLTKNAKNHGSNNNLFVREVQIKDQVFEQYIHYLSDKRLIRSYIFDFTKRKQLEAQLKESQQRYKAVIAQIEEGIFLVDIENNKILESNSIFSDLLGYSLDEIYSLTLNKIINLDLDLLQREINNSFNEYSKINRKLSFRHQNGSLIRLETNISLIQYGDQEIFCFSIIKDNKKTSQKTSVQKSSLHDLLTGLPNRNLFLEQLNTAIANNRRKENLLCLLFLELGKIEDFKNSISATIQSNLLEGFAKRLKSSLRSGDTVARWEDNQFIILLPHVRSIKDIGKIASRILKVLQPSFFVEKQNIYVTTNIGISIHGEDGDNVGNLLNSATEALEKSKQKEGNSYHFYNDKIQSDIERLLRLEELLVHALDKEELILDYQPQVNFRKKQITGLETLLRWQHPELGKIAPAQFISLAEETGLIIPIGEWILEKACTQNKIWQQNGLESLPISVNISPQQFKQTNLVPLIKSVLEETGLEGRFLELEINESIVMENPDLAAEVIGELNTMGVKICLDDFGSGVSGVGYLKKLRFDTLKIDREIMKNIHENTQDLAIISALINLGKSFEVRVVAEGVETRQQMDLLYGLGCTEIQGNIFTKPLTSEEMTDFLSNPAYQF